MSKVVCQELRNPKTAQGLLGVLPVPPPRWRIFIFFFLTILITIFRTTTPAKASIDRCKQAIVKNEDDEPIIYSNSDQIRFESKVDYAGTYKISIVGASQPYHGFWPSKEIKDPETERLEASFSRSCTGAFSLGSHQIIVELVRGTEEEYCAYPYNVVEKEEPTPTPDTRYHPPYCTITIDSNTDPINGQKFTPGVDIFFRVKAENAPHYSHRVVVRPAGCERNESDVFIPPDSGNDTFKKCNLGTFEVILQGNFAKYGWKDTPCTSGFCIEKEGCEAVPTTTPTPTPVCPQECRDILDKQYPTGSRLKDYACLKPQCKQNCDECSVECPFPKCIDLATEELYCNEEECQENCLGCGATPKPSIPMPDIESLCQKATDLGNYDCIHCLRGEAPYDRPGLWTAIGCVPIDFAGFINEYVFTFGVGIAGGIAFLYFIYGCFLVLTSTGNPEKIAQAKQIILSALSGLLFIIFSVFILRIIGVEILKIPGFE